MFIQSFYIFGSNLYFRRVRWDCWKFQSKTNHRGHGNPFEGSSFLPQSAWSTVLYMEHPDACSIYIYLEYQKVKWKMYLYIRAWIPIKLQWKNSLNKTRGIKNYFLHCFLLSPKTTEKISATNCTQSHVAPGLFPALKALTPKKWCYLAPNLSRARANKTKTLLSGTGGGLKH